VHPAQTGTSSTRSLTFKTALLRQTVRFATPRLTVAPGAARGWLRAFARREMRVPLASGGRCLDSMPWSADSAQELQSQFVRAEVPRVAVRVASWRERVDKKEAQYVCDAVLRCATLVSNSWSVSTVLLTETLQAVVAGPRRWLLYASRPAFANNRRTPRSCASWLKAPTLGLQ
jgi:hypothetical protein